MDDWGDSVIICNVFCGVLRGFGVLFIFLFLLIFIVLIIIFVLVLKSWELIVVSFFLVVVYLLVGGLFCELELLEFDNSLVVEFGFVL